MSTSILIKKESKKNEIQNRQKINSEDIPEDKNQKLVDKIINKWLDLQKIIKEEITLEDVIIKQQQDDTNDLKNFFVKYYQAKLNTRKNLNYIKKLKLDDKEPNILSYHISQELGPSFHDASEPIKNLFFILRDNYDYLTRLISLITPEDYYKNIEKIYSLVELLNNHFYENILIPNPEQQELLILIYKLFEEEILSMSGVCQENFLKDDTFLGIFLSSFVKKQEIIGYFSMILNPLILSIDDDDSKDSFDLSIDSIIKSIDIIRRKNTKISNGPPNASVKKVESEKEIENILYKDIPNTKIKFKNSFELEAEKEKEDEVKYDVDEDEAANSGKDINFINKKRKTLMLKNKSNSFIEEFNDEYYIDLTQNRLVEKITKENDPELKHVFIKLLEQINYYPNKFTNEGLIQILKLESEKRASLTENYKENFMYIRETIEGLLQIIVDKIITLPYPLRCICKIISILISKKFPYLSKYEVNSFIGKFILDKCIFPLLRLENKTFLDQRVYSKKTKNCLDIVISVLSKANSSSLFDTYSDPEKTIFNQFILEIIPIMNKFYDKITDIQLQKVINDLISETTKKIDELSYKRIFNFRYKKEQKEKSPNEEKSADNAQSPPPPPPPLYEYFLENPDEILHLQSLCFSADDVIFLLELIGRDIDLFKDLPRFNFFSKTYKKIKNEEEIITNLSKEDENNRIKTFFIIFKDEKNSILQKLLTQKKKGTSSFESSEQDSELICKRIKFCIKTILKGLNLLNNKDFAYLNFAQSSDKFFSALKYTLEELGEYNELSNAIPLKWYSQYIYNYKKELNEVYQKEDFAKLYSEISTEETNILNELKNLSSTVITRIGMNLRCAEKILDRSIYELRQIEESRKFNQLEKFISSKPIEVCISQIDDANKVLTSEKSLPVNITEIKSCPFGNSSFDKNHCHLNNIEDFIKLFSSKSLKLKQLISEDIHKGERKYKIYEIIGKYMEIISKKIRENKSIFGELKEDEIKQFIKNIENHIIRQIYKYVYPPVKLKTDIELQNATRILEWIQPENLDIKKLYVNQLKFAEKYINKMNEAKSVYDKLECIQNAYVIMNNTVKFISGKNENAGQDELTPLFQYVLIKSQPERLSTNINYIKCFLSEVDLIGRNGFYFSQMESACTFILNIKSSDLKIDENEFNKNMAKYKKKYESRKSGVYK